MEKNKKLLVDVMPLDIINKKMNESIEDGGEDRLFIKGVVQRADIKNKNGRVYPKEILEREVKKYKDKIKANSAVGELDHPENSVVSLGNTSHKFVDLEWDGSDLIGTLMVASTPAGGILENLINDNIRVGISSRGLGSVNDSEDGKIVQDDYDLIAWDIVSNPSTHGAYVDAINESDDKDNKHIVCDKYCQVNNLMNKILTYLK